MFVKISMKGNNKKPPITFETEEELNDEIKVVVNDLTTQAAKDPKLEPFLEDISKMYTFFSSAYHKNIRLLEALQEMNTSVVLNAARIQLLTKSVNGDHTDLSKLKSQYDEASKMVAFVHEAEAKSKKIMQQLRDTLEALMSEIEHGEAWCCGEETSVVLASQEVKNLNKERDEGEATIKQMQAEIATRRSEIESMNQSMKKMKGDIQSLEATIEERDKLLRECAKDTEESQTLISDLKSKIPVMQSEFDESAKKKSRIEHENKIRQKERYDVLQLLTQAKDEAKRRSAKGTRKKRQLIELKKIGEAFDVRVESDSQQLKDREEELSDRKQELEKLEKMAIETNQRADEEDSRLQHLADQRMDVKKKMKELLPQVVHLKFDYARSQGVTEAKQRDVKNAQASLGLKKKQKEAADAKLSEARSQLRTVRSETKHMKPKLEEEKSRIGTIFQELDTKKLEVYRINAGICMFNESRGVVDKENETQQKELKELQSKVASQVQLTDDIREERNLYKKQLDGLEKENAQLTLQNKDLEAEVHELEDKWRTMLEDIASMHFQIKSEIECTQKYEGLCDNIENNIHTVERMITRLQIENQTLTHILHEAEVDHLQQLKEQELLMKNRITMHQEHSEKSAKVEEMRTQIKTDESYLSAYSKMYNDKVAEVAGLLTKLNALREHGRELEKKCVRVEQLKYIRGKTTTLLLFERQKTAALISEFSVPRNVHRWNAIEAVNPELVKQLKFRCGLTGKINDAQRELDQLNKEKSDLAAQLAAMKNKMAQIGTKAAWEEEMKTLRMCLARMDNEIDEYSVLLGKGKPQLGMTKQRLSGARSSLTQRKGKALHVKNQVTALASLTSTDTEEEPYFITESPLYNPMMGGGFSLRPGMSRRSVPTSELAVASPVRKNGRKSSLGPMVLPAKAAKSPPRFFGRSLVLPAIS